MFLLNQIRDNHIFTNYWQWLRRRSWEKKKKKLGHKIYWVGSFLSGRSGYRKFYNKFLVGLRNEVVESWQWAHLLYQTNNIQLASLSFSFSSFFFFFYFSVLKMAVYIQPHACVFTIQPHACGAILNPGFWIQPHAHKAVHTIYARTTMHIVYQFDNGSPLLTLLIYKLFSIILIMFPIISVKYGHCTLMTSFPYYNEIIIFLLTPISRDLRWRKLSWFLSCAVAMYVDAETSASAALARLLFYGRGYPVSGCPLHFAQLAMGPQPTSRP